MPSRLAAGPRDTIHAAAVSPPLPSPPRLSLLHGRLLVSPGKFTAALDLRKDGSFSYSYKGEIYLLGLSKLAEMGAKDDDTFKPAACYKDTNFKGAPARRQSWISRRRNGMPMLASARRMPK